ncbi:MAG: hypothetical protein IKP00_11315 [Victivallales bacterium]|nr:hypothetical protein [Victivallales bacterium]
MRHLISSLFCAMAMVMAGEWNRNEFFAQKLVASVPGILKQYHPETGRFGSEPWVCNDQNNMFPLAVAWWVESKDNSYYHSPELLKVIVKAGDALIDDMDEKGMWLFRKKDNSTWGMIHMPWTYSRWIRSYALVRDAMTSEEQERWDKALKLGFSHIQKYCKSNHVQNIPCHHAMGLYAAGRLFGNEEWMKTASDYMAKVVAAQDSEGFWTEHFGPVVSYNFVYIDALGDYYAMSKDPVVIPALEKAARYHASILFKDGTSAACLDERNGYNTSLTVGNPGFTWTAIGRGFLEQQFNLSAVKRMTFVPDYLAAMLLHGGTGETISPAELGENGFYLSNNKKLAKLTRGEWQLCVTGYACKPTTNRWIMERQNMMDIYLHGRGLVVGGGNTRMQPLLSTFTFGDTSLLVMDNTSTTPNFLPNIPLKWVPDSAEILREGDGLALKMAYGSNKVSVKAIPQTENTKLSLTFTLENAAEAPCEAHLPIMHKSSFLRLSDGTRLPLGEKLEMTAEELKGGFIYNGVRYEMPPNSRLCWPVKIFNQYAKDGVARKGSERMVLCIPLGQEANTSATLSLVEDSSTLIKDALCFMAADLPVTGSANCAVKVINVYGDQLMFIGTTRLGETMTLTMDVPEAGNYELIVEYLMAYSYGISQLSLDGKPVGKPYNGYSPEIEYDFPLSYGRVDLTKGPHTLTLTTIDRDSRATTNNQSIRAIYLKK